MTDAPEPVERLACGARVDLIFDQVSAGRADVPTAHQADCPHCRAALAEYDRLWRPIREMAASDLRAPESVLDRAFARLRAATADPGYATLPGTRGVTRIAARIVVVTARETTQHIAGVRVALSRLLPDADGTTGPAPQVVAGVAGRSTAIEITLAAEYGTDLEALGATIRAEVARRVRELTGLEPIDIAVHIDDVFD